MQVSIVHNWWRFMNFSKTEPILQYFPVDEYWLCIITRTISSMSTIPYK